MQTWESQVDGLRKPLNMRRRLSGEETSSTYAFDDARAGPCHEPFDALGPVCRQGQSGAILRRRKERGALLKAVFERL